MKIDAEGVDFDLAPSPRLGLISWQVDDEVVIVDVKTRYTAVLNGFASLIWRCLDGRATLGELVPDLAFAFDVPCAVVAEHVLAFGRDIGRSGLLANVAARVNRPHPVPAIGDTLAEFTTGRIDGLSCGLGIPPGQMTLVVNWSLSCRYCISLAPELAALLSDLRRAGIDVILLASGEKQENVDLLERYALDAMIALRPLANPDVEDPFLAMGTPVACLVNERGVIQADPAVGSTEVVRLARWAAGIPEPVFPTSDFAPLGPIADTVGDAPKGPKGPRYLSATPSAGVCGPTTARRSPRTWEPVRTYQIGDFLIGVRADSEATDRLLDRALAANRGVGEGVAPPHLSVVLAAQERGAQRPFNLLLLGEETVIRSRSTVRVVRGLAAYLSALVVEEEEAAEAAPSPTAMLAVSALPAIFGSVAVLLPAALRLALAAAQPRLARAGFRLVDVPRATIDVRTGHLVVPRPRVKIDEAAFDTPRDPATGPSEGAWVPPGRYPLAAWALGPVPNGGDAFTMGSAVATAWAACIHRPGPPGAALSQLNELFQTVDALPMSGATLTEIVDDLRRRVAIRHSATMPIADGISVGGT